MIGTLLNIAAILIGGVIGLVFGARIPEKLKETVIAGMGLFIGGKLFDYIGQNVQILAMLPRGDSRAILESLDWGVICDPDPNDVAEAIERLLRLPRPDRPADPTGRFDRAFLAQRLAHALEEVAGVGPDSNDERPSNDRAGSLDLDRVGR